MFLEINHSTTPLIESKAQLVKELLGESFSGVP